MTQKDLDASATRIFTANFRRSPRDKIKHPSYKEAYPDELQECFTAVPQLLFRRAVRDRSEDDRDEESEGEKVQKMDHFFLPK
jgi:hypothetical protein